MDRIIHTEEANSHEDEDRQQPKFLLKAVLVGIGDYDDHGEEEKHDACQEFC